MKILAVVVTYNRIEKLKKTLLAYDAIKRGLDTLVVVNNKSTDGTPEYLSEWKGCKSSFNKSVLNLDENLGGSGGFFNGCQHALSLGADWILVADDDAYPNPDIIEQFETYSKDQSLGSVSAICSTVKHMDGTVDLGHRKKYVVRFGLRPVFAPMALENYKKKYFEIDLFSYVGTFLNADSLNKVGLCNPDYFIYYDDTEHSMRMRENGRIVCVPSIAFSHDDGYGQVKEQSNIAMSWRDFYDIRNKINMFFRHDKKVAYFWIASRYIMCFVKYPFCRKCQKLYLAAVRDGISGKLGKHPIYKPGFSIIK